EFEVLMKGEFEMSALGEMTFFLGLQVKQLPDGIFISQDNQERFQVSERATKLSVKSKLLWLRLQQKLSILLLLAAMDRMVSAGRSMFLLVVLIPAGSFVPAGSYGLCWWLRVPAGRHTSAGGSISIASVQTTDLICAGSIMFLLVDLFVLVVTCICCLNIVSAVLKYDTAGWSVSTGSHSVSTGSLQSCWYNHVSADEQWHTTCTFHYSIATSKALTLQSNSLKGIFYPIASFAALKYNDDHNKIAYLGREKGCKDFPDILNYLDQSPLRYALTHDPPVVFDSLVKQFWATAVVCPNEAVPHDLVATIDGHEVVVTESLIRTQLQLADANGIFNMQINDIFEGMRVIGYPTHGTLTFYKTNLSPQWRFLVHTIMHCMSPKSGSWNQFPSSIATALICLSTGRTYNFSRFILEGMIGNVKATKHKFLMYPRFLQTILAFETADRTPRPTFAFTRKLFANMKFRWAQDPVPLTPPMMAIAAGGNATGDAPVDAAAGGDAPAGAAAGGDAADEANIVTNDAVGGAAEAPQVPQSPPHSSLETEWVVLDPVSPVADWRPWPYVHVHFSEPESLPFPPEQTVLYEEPVKFGLVPRPTG
nr:hypothetical protein [Tanacetum cinerariifolium]